MLKTRRLSVSCLFAAVVLASAAPWAHATPGILSVTWKESGSSKQMVDNRSRAYLEIHGREMDTTSFCRLVDSTGRVFNLSRFSETTQIVKCNLPPLSSVTPVVPPGGYRVLVIGPGGEEILGGAVGLSGARITSFTPSSVDQTAVQLRIEGRALDEATSVGLWRGTADAGAFRTARIQRLDSTSGGAVIVATWDAVPVGAYVVQLHDEVRTLLFRTTATVQVFATPQE